MTKPFKIFLAALAIVLGLVTFAAKADDTVTWLHPIEYTDATPLNAADIASTIVRYGVGTSTNPPTVVSSVTVPAPATSVVIPRDPLVAGTVCYQAATLMKPVPPATVGEQSSFAPAAWVCKTIAPPPPKKPRQPRNVAVQ